MKVGNPLFGDWSGFDRGHGAVFVQPPVGELCLRCEEPIAEGDVGELIPCIAKDEKISIRPLHRECLMLGILGHDYGVCGCTEMAGAATLREAAIELDRRVAELGPPWDRGQA